MIPSAEADWYPGKLNPHPLGSAPERFEKHMSQEERRHRDREDAKKLENLRKRLAATQSRVVALRAARDEVTGPLFAKRNVQYVNCLNDVVNIQEQIEALFVEQETA